MIAIAPKVYGYIRVSTDRQALSPEAQRAACLEAVRRLGLTVDAWFQDAPVANPDGTWNDAQSARIPLPERPAGKLLVARLRKGDTVVVAKIDRAFRRLSDCVLLLDRWERNGVRLVLCDFPTLMPADDAFGKAMLQMIAVFAEVERKLISQRTREALALRKKRGQANGRYAGYGYRYEKRWDRKLGKYLKFKIRDEEERRVMKQIVRWKRDGSSWDEIYYHLDQLQVVTKDGKPWSRSRIVRACHAELQLQLQEAGSGGSRPG